MWRGLQNAESEGPAIMTNIAELMREAAEPELAKWMSAALCDPTVCDEMQADIRAWFGITGRMKQAAAELERAEPVAWIAWRGESEKWFHESEQEIDIIHGAKWERAPLYRRPPTSAVPEDGVLVPVEMVEILRSAVELHQKRGTVLTVHMNDIALLLDQVAAPQQGGSDSE